MSRRIVEFSPRAAEEIAAARRWWIENRDKAPDAFDSELSTLIDSLESQAELTGQPASNMPGLRRVLLKRIRYYLYFRISVNQRVQVASLWHASRGDEPALRTKRPSDDV